MASLGDNVSKTCVLNIGGMKLDDNFLYLNMLNANKSLRKKQLENIYGKISAWNQCWEMKPYAKLFIVLENKSLHMWLTLQGQIQPTAVTFLLKCWMLSWRQDVSGRDDCRSTNTTPWMRLLSLPWGKNQDLFCTEWLWKITYNWYVLIQCGLVIPYGVINLIQHWVR